MRGWVGYFSILSFQTYSLKIWCWSLGGYPIFGYYTRYCTLSISFSLSNTNRYYLFFAVESKYVWTYLVQ